MPPDKTDEELPEDFAEFFLSKIEKIRENSSTCQHTSPYNRILPNLHLLSTQRNESMYSHNEHEEQAW